MYCVHTRLWFIWYEVPGTFFHVRRIISQLYSYLNPIHIPYLLGGSCSARGRPLIVLDNSVFLHRCRKLLHLARAPPAPAQPLCHGVEGVDHGSRGGSAYRVAKHTGLCSVAAAGARELEEGDAAQEHDEDDPRPG